MKVPFRVFTLSIVRFKQNFQKEIEIESGPEREDIVIQLIDLDQINLDEKNHREQKERKREKSFSF